MKREIKFRALNASGEFIYGLPYTDGVNETLYFDDYSNRMCWRDENGSHCNQPYKNGTLQQFTGLQDKNGKDIFEGDILGRCFDDYNENCEVVYLNGVLSARAIKSNKFRPLNIMDGYGWCRVDNGSSNYDFRIIGNIYDNPELLK